MQQELKDAITKCEDLEQKSKDQATKLSSVRAAIQEARSEARGAREELHQVRLIEDGKSYLLQSVFGGNRFALLMRVWRSSGTFVNLPSASDAAKYFTSYEGCAKQRLFWAQFQAPEHPSLLNN